MRASICVCHWWTYSHYTFIAMQTQQRTTFNASCIHITFNRCFCFSSHRICTHTQRDSPVHILSEDRTLPHFAFSIMSCFTCFVVDMWKPHKARLIVITASARLRFHIHLRCAVVLFTILYCCWQLLLLLLFIFLQCSVLDCSWAGSNVKITKSEVSCQH